MSEWIEIKDQDDVDLSVGGKELHVLYGRDECGNKYIAIPIEFLPKAQGNPNCGHITEYDPQKYEEIRCVTGNSLEKKTDNIIKYNFCPLCGKEL